MNSHSRRVGSLSVLVLLLWGLASERGVAQPIVPAADGTGTIVLPNGDRFDIQGGQRSGDRLNLFHSFLRFGLDAHQIANFLSQPGIQNILARVGGGDPSVINGLLRVTGGNSNLYLMNPAGIVFGPRAQLDIPASFVATTATAVQFKSGLFAAVGQPDYGAIAGAPLGLVFPQGQPGAIVNAGSLSVNSGQGLELVGGTVVSTGSLAAPGGSIQVTAVEGGRYVRVGQAGHVLSLDLPADLGGRQLADGGIPVTALPELLRGREAGTGLRVSGDTVQLADSGLQVPTTAGTTVIAGEVNVAAGMNVTGGKGGTVHLLGERVGLVGATADASGLNGGGTVLVGGDFRGEGSVPNAQQTFVDPTSVISASALQAGDGGKVILWADGSTDFRGSINAKGGQTAGDGGFVEVSGKEFLAFSGDVNVSTEHGKSGTLLLDPENITISNLANSPPGVVGALPDIFRNDFLGQDININQATLEGQTGNIILQASNNITIASGVTLAFSVPGGSIEFDASNNFNMGSSDFIFTRGRSLTIKAGNDINAGIISTNSAAIDGNAGDLSLQAGNNISVDSLFARSSTPINEGVGAGRAGKITIQAGGQFLADPQNIAFTGSVDSYGNPTSVRSSGQVAGSGGVEIQARSIISSGLIGAFTSPTDGTPLLGPSGLTKLTADSISLPGLFADNLEISSNNVQITGSGFALGNASESFSINTRGRTLTIQQPSTLVLPSGTILRATVDLGADTIIQSGNITIDGGPINSISGNHSLNIQSGVILNSTIGANTPLLSLNISGISTINSGFIRTLGNQNYSNSVALGGNTQFDAGQGTINFNGALNTGNNNLSLVADEINFSGGNNSVGGTGNLTLLPSTLTQDITIGGTADTGTTSLDLTVSDINALTNGFNSITVGRTDGTGSIAIPGTVTFADPTIFNAPGGTIDITGTLIGIDNASFTFNTTLGMTLGNITTPGTDLTFNAPITLATPATVSTGAGPGNITFNGTINGNNSFTVTAGTGDIQLNGPIGNTDPIGSLTITSAANTTATANITTNNGDVTINNSPLTIAAPLTITAGTGTIALNNTVTAGPNDTTLSANEINLNGGPNSVTGSGNLTLQPGTPTQNTILGQAADSGPTALDLTQTDLTAVANGFNSITIGRPDGTGSIFVPGNVTFFDPLILQAPGGSIDITGSITGLDNASITLNAGVRIGLGQITTNNTDINLNAPVQLLTPARLDTGPGPGNITFTSTIDGLQPLVLNAGTGTVQFGGIIGGTTPIGSLLVEIAQNTIIPSNITTANGNITINGPTTITGNATLNAGTATIALNGPVSIGANTVTLAANEIDLNGGPNSVTGTGNLTLQPGTANQNIELGAANDTGPTTLNLTAADLLALANGFNSLTIGHPNGSGTITIPVDLTFFDPVTIRAPQAPGSIAIANLLTGADNASITLTASRINLGNITTNNNNITLNGPAIVNTGDAELNAGTATILANSQLNTGGNTLTLTADEIDFRGGSGSVLGGGNLILQPFTPSLNIEIGGFVPAPGRLDLDFADVSAIGNGFNLITIGREDSSGTITIPNAITFLDPVKIQTPLGANTIIANGPITLIDNASIELLALGNIFFTTIDALNATGNVVITSTAGRVIGTGTFLTDAGPTTIATSTGTVTITGGVVPDVPFTIGLPFDPNNPDDWNGTVGVIRTAAETFPAGTIIYGSETSPGGTMTVNAGGQRPLEPPVEPPVEEPPVEPPVEEPPLEEPPIEPPLEEPPVGPPVEEPPDGDGIPDIRPDPTRNLLYPTLHEGKRRELADIVAQVDQNDFHLRLSLMLNNALDALERGDVDGIRQIEEARQLEFENYFGVEIDCSYLDTSIREESPQGSQEVSCKILPLSEIQQALRELAAATGHTPGVIYAISKLDRLQIVLVKPTGNPVVKTIGDANVVTLANTVDRFTKPFAEKRVDIRPDEVEYRTLAQPIYDWLVGAIKAELTGIDTLLFSLDHRLRSLPLATLQDPEGKFLIESYHLALIPSVSLTSRSYTQDFQTGPRLAMGRSEFRDVSLHPLPAVPTELSLVNETTQHLNYEFTLRNLQTFRQAERFGVVHLATHAKFRPEAIANSYIQLWDQPLRLNQLRTAQLSQPNILDLLVMSACETALGDREAELGFAGLAVAAGVKSAIASLWEVGDIGTLAFMAELYQVQLPNTRIKAEAIRNTQLALLTGQVNIDNGKLRLSNGTIIALPDPLKDSDSNLIHPYTWSAFTLIGSPW